MSEKRQPPPPKRAEREKNKCSGNHQLSWLWGHYAVLETLATGVWPVYEIVSNANAFKQSCEVLAAKHAAGIPPEIVDNDRLQQLTGSSEHQGLAVRLGPFPYQSLDSLSTRLQLSPPSDNVPLVVSGYGFRCRAVLVRSMPPSPLAFCCMKFVANNTHPAKRKCSCD